MKVLKIIGNFFAAMVPFIVYYAAQFIVLFLGIFAAYAAEMMSISAFPETISDKSVLVISAISNLICFFAAIAEMKIHRFSFKDVSPIRQNGRVYIMAVFFAIGAFFAFILADSLVMKIPGMPQASAAQEMTNSMIVFTLIVYLTDALAEELVFRGLMVRTFEKRFPTWVGAAAATVIYTLIYNAYSICFILLFSIVLMFIRYKFGDLKLCILFHLTVTFMAVIVSLVNADHYGSILYIGGAVGVVIAAAAMFFMLKFASRSDTASDNA